MPALQPVLFTARVACRGTSQGAAIVNVFHVAWAGGPMDTPVITYIANLVKGAYEANFVPRLNGNYSGDTVRAVDLTSADGVEATVALAGTVGASTPFMPQSAACCITWRINRHYRGGHPRTYLGPLHSNAIETPTSLTSTYVGQVQTGANAFLAAINAGTTGGAATSLVAVHRQVDGAQVLVPFKSPILSAVVDTRIDTMRRRLGRDR